MRIETLVGENYFRAGDSNSENSEPSTLPSFISSRWVDYLSTLLALIGLGFTSVLTFALYRNWILVQPEQGADGVFAEARFLIALVSIALVYVWLIANFIYSLEANHAIGEIRELRKKRISVQKELSELEQSLLNSFLIKLSRSRGEGLIEKFESETHGYLRYEVYDYLINSEHLVLRSSERSSAE